MRVDGWTPVMRSVLLVVVVLIAVAALLWFLQRRLIYLPGGAPPPVAEVLPAADEVTIRTEDGLELTAWFVEAGPTAVVVFPGNAGNRALRAPLAEALAARGPSVLLLDYRGYGGNPGVPTEAGLQADARAAVRWASGRPGIERLVFLGESLGASVAVAAATEHRPAALVLRSPFPSLLTVARQHYGPVPGVLLRDEYPVASQLERVAAPVLVVAGETDTIVPPELSREVFAAAPEPKRFVSVPGAGHNDRALLDGDAFVSAIMVFLADHAAVEG